MILEVLKMIIFQEFGNFANNQKNIYYSGNQLVK